jgi:hypothetical protein
MINSEKGGLQIIVGRSLSSVEFVLDYVQLRFDGPCLTAITMPILRCDNQVLKNGMQGYCDCLIKQIGKVVNLAIVKEEELLLQFSGGASLTISLRPEDNVGPEAARFEDETGNFWVW